MRLYRAHMGSHAVRVTAAPDALDVVASRRDDTLFVHVANTRRTASVRAALAVQNRQIRSGRVFQIAGDTTEEVSYLNSGDVMITTERAFERGGAWEFPPASVSVLELQLSPALP
jgi:hypothetical protein